MKIHDFSNRLYDYQDKTWEQLNDFLIKETNNYNDPCIYSSIKSEEKNNVLTTWYQQSGTRDWQSFYDWSITHRSDFWQLAIERLHIIWKNKYTHHQIDTQHPDDVEWCKNGRLNIIQSCLNDSNQIALLFKSESSSKIISLSYHDLHLKVKQVTHGLTAYIQPNDHIIFYAPFSIEIVTLFLSCIALGAIPVLVSDSFSAEELNLRISLTNAKFVFSTTQYIYNGKTIDLSEKVLQSNIENILWTDEAPDFNTNKKTINYSELINHTITSDIPYYYASSNEPCILLFSSGTTSTPKIIPWTHLTPIKCATDAQLIHQITTNDTLCWATSMGWMMAPWVLFAGLLNQASIALYQGSPTNKEFITFTEQTEVTILGLIPSIVQVWKEKKITSPSHWKVRLFSSTGEASHPATYFYLYHLHQMNAPIIEYCGGTEIGGAYIASTTELPLMMSAFNTIVPGLAIEFDNHHNTNEIFITPPSIGLSQELLNKNHREVYYDSENNYKRKHGDGMLCIHYKNYLFYKSVGRVDDSMNLGGIKISAVEIENCLSTHPQIKEIAAIGYSENNLGAEQLVVYVVLNNEYLESKENLKKSLQQYLSVKLNPLFKIYSLQLIDSLPRTASNKIMRRSLKELFLQTQSH